MHNTTIQYKTQYKTGLKNKTALAFCNTKETICLVYHICEWLLTREALILGVNQLIDDFSEDSE